MSEYHFFSDREFAGPTYYDVLRFWDRESRQLRLQSRFNLPKFRFQDSNEFAIPSIGNHENAQQIANFWNNYYKGNDWFFHCTAQEIVKWMDHGFILLIKKP